MPPRIRSKVSKAQKENIDTRSKVKSTKVTTKAPRKALTDKTNSASDDNSFEVPNKKKAVLKNSNIEPIHNAEYKDDVRPRRDRRLPSRFVKNAAVTNLCSKKDNIALKDATVNSTKSASATTSSPIKKTTLETSSIEIQSIAETSLVVHRPKRICRLPSRFNDHSISPSKFIPLQPQNASTPIQQSKFNDQQAKNHKANKENSITQTEAILPVRSAKAKALNKVLTLEISPDTNNNAKTNSKAKKAKILSSKKDSRQRNTIRNYFNDTASVPSPAKKVNLKSINDVTLKRVINKIPEVRVLGCNKRSPESEKKKSDVYEFTFDPDEEPQTQKKKRKKPAIKKAPNVTKPKAVVSHKTTYDQNIFKALAALKNAVKHSKAKQPKAKLPQITEMIDDEDINVEQNNFAKISAVPNINDSHETPVHPNGYSSIRIEDIAADIEPDLETSLDNDVDLNYSPVNSPHPIHSTNPTTNDDARDDRETYTDDADPLNLQKNLSFFDDIPVASSSMNTSVRHPLASPWRVEFGNLPIKWHSNAYVKPNMTPAVESSFICSEDSNKKKHVYTNMILEVDDPSPKTLNSENLKQTSIISFIKEVVEKKAQANRRRQGSPSKGISIVQKTTEEKTRSEDAICVNNTSEELSTSNNSVSNAKEKSKRKKNTRKRKNVENTSDDSTKSPQKQKDKDCTYFGFDESENQDQENVSPVKVKDNITARSLRSRAVLQEMNGPSRAMLPVAVKTKKTTSSQAVNKVYEGIKSAEDAPVFPQNDKVTITNLNEDPSFNDDSQSVHLFEDIEVVHHLKPTRKSYGNNKKVTFCQESTSPSETQNKVHHNVYSDDDDFADLTFEMPNLTEKKKTKKKKPKKMMSKKEQKEAEEWAAGFNSMCEEIEEFPLVVE